MKNLKFDRRHSEVTAVTLFLLLAMTVSLIALPSATAADTWQTYAYLGATPNPVGVGQEVLLHVGIKHPLALTTEGWEDLTVTVTRPDGKTETLGPFKTDATGGTGTVYVPTMAGNYTLQSHFPEQTLPSSTSRPFSTPAGTTMLASDSPKVTLVVTEESITYYPGHALPAEYWTRPIDAQLREWNVIAGSWLDTSRRNPQVIEGNEYAPDTAHILWTTPITQGGLVGGDTLDGHSFEIGDAYEGKWTNRLILAGKLYYDIHSDSDHLRTHICVDLHTGEELWTKTFPGNDTIDRGQLMYWDTYDFHGVFDYLWTSETVGSRPNTSTHWHAWDPITGEYVYTLYDVPSGTIVYGPKGEILIYNIDTRNGYMTLWNSTNIPQLYGSTQYATQAWGEWRPQGDNRSATGPTVTTPTTPLGLAGYMWNVSIPDDLSGSVRAVFPLDKAVGSSYSDEQVVSWGINLNASNGAIGSKLFRKEETAPSAWRTGNLTIAYQTTNEDVFVYFAIQTNNYYAYSAKTGAYLWVTPISENYLNFYGWTEFGERPAILYEGKMFSSGVSGIVYCYDLTDGDLLWEYHAADPYSEILWANDWWLFPVFATDGKIYYGHLEHSPIDPRPRGGPFICLNATTGDVVFRADGLFRQNLWGGLGIIGDSIIATMDTYDQRLYAIGKGPSATTVSAPDVGVPIGKSVLVQGMVTDVSPGTNSAGLEMRFPNGVPAVCDANMSEWMLYVYKQFERPADVVGVEVVVSVLDPNNNCYEVGRTTGDVSGAFSVAFTPPVPGKYTVIASFEGSGAYYGSFAETAINVEEAPVSTPAPTPTPAPMTDTYIIGFGSAMLVAIIIGFVLLLLRKR
jgi:outer membrane protein assembly factor BamB